MNSEKVKEIKEKLKEHYYYLDQAYSDYLAYGGKADEQQEEKIHFFGDILTIINELESENERLKTQLAQANAEIVNCSGCKLVEINAVNEFAEKVKNKLFEFFQDNEGLDGKISVGTLYVDVIGVEAKDGTIISLGLIDRLLKEYKMSNKSKTEKWKYWLIEDGSVDVEDLQQFMDENNLKIKIIIYRQGSVKPELKSF